MSSAVESLLSQPWNKVASEMGGDFSELTQSELKREWRSCEKSAYPEVCIRSAIAINPVLNRCKVARAAINQWTY